jgi:hypothetical protein
MTAIPPARPLKPRKGLFVALCVLTAAWVVGLIVMYVMTVAPRDGPDLPPTSPAAAWRAMRPASTETCTKEKLPAVQEAPT